MSTWAFSEPEGGQALVDTIVADDSARPDVSDLPSPMVLSREPDDRSLVGLARQGKEPPRSRGLPSLDRRYRRGP
jgi:hypothetical protein